MDKPKATPKDFFLWAGAMLTLYVGVFSFVALLFDYIEYTFPGSWYNQYGYNPFQGSVSYEMASLIVLTPVFMLLMRSLRRTMQKDPSRREVWVRRWALFLTAFIAGATIVIDLIVLLTTFLRGEELTTGFLLKVLVVLLVAGAGFMHFLADIWGYWDKNPRYARYINWAVGAVVLAAVLSGFVIIGTPAEARKALLDQQRVEHLQQIQSQVVYYWQQKEVLPGTLDSLAEDPLSSFMLPRDPHTGEAYEYEVTGPRSFRLCAIFETDRSLPDEAMRSVYSDLPAPEKWHHSEGRTCFDRAIDPDLYPPFKSR